MEFNFSSQDTFFRSEYLNHHGFICLVTGLSHEKHLSCPHTRELPSSFPDIFKLWQLERNSMKSCIFVNKDTPKFKGARGELCVINCIPPGFSSREALAQETDQLKMPQWRMVPAVAQKQARHFACSGSRRCWPSNRITSSKKSVRKRALLGWSLSFKNKNSRITEIRSMATEECSLSRVMDDDLYATRHLMSENNRLPLQRDGISAGEREKLWTFMLLCDCTAMVGPGDQGILQTPHPLPTKIHAYTCTEHPSSISYNWESN